MGKTAFFKALQYREMGLVCSLLLVQVAAVQAQWPVLPDGCSSYKGAAIGAGDFDSRLRAIFQKHCVIWYERDKVCRNAAGMDYLLNSWANSTGHTEIGTIGVVQWGGSHAATYPFCKAAQAPARMIAGIPIDAVPLLAQPGYTVEGTWTLTDAKYLDSGMAKVPMLFTVGDGDNICGTENARFAVLEGRKRDALWALAIRRDMGHVNMNTETNLLVAAWLDAILQRRLAGATVGSDGKVQYTNIDPSTGWLGSMDLKMTLRYDEGIPIGVRYGPDSFAVVNSAHISPYGSFIGDKSKASWLPNEETARLWLKVMTGSDQVDTTILLTGPTQLDYFPTAIGEIVPISITTRVASSVSVEKVLFYKEKDGAVSQIGEARTGPYNFIWQLEAYKSNNQNGWEHFNLYAVLVDSQGKQHISQWIPVEVYMPASQASRALRSPGAHGAVIQIRGNELVVHVAGQQIISVDVVGLNGAIIQTANAGRNGASRLALGHLTPGCYVVRVTTNKAGILQRVTIRP